MATFETAVALRESKINYLLDLGILFSVIISISILLMWLRYTVPEALTKNDPNLWGIVVSLGLASIAIPLWFILIGVFGCINRQEKIIKKIEELGLKKD